MSVMLSASEQINATLDFTIKTKSGDTISLSAYNKNSRSASFEQTSDQTTMTLKQEIAMGYAFHYEGNGIDANDKKEIDDALKKMQPSLNDFIKTLSDPQQQKSNVPSSLISSMSEFFGSMLPKSTDHNTQNYQKNNLLDTFNNALKNVAPSQKNIEDITDLLTKLMMKIDGTALHNGKTFYA